MKFSTVFTAALLGASASAAVYRRDVPAIKKALDAIKPGFEKMDKAVQDITKENVKEQMNVIASAAEEFNKLAVAAAGDLKNSPPITITGVFSLVTPIVGWARDLNTTIVHIIEKAPIVVEAKETDHIMHYIHITQDAQKALAKAFINQIPQSIREPLSQIQSQFGLPGLNTDEDIDKMFAQQDKLMDKAMKGEEITLADLLPVGGDPAAAKPPPGLSG